MGLSFSKHHELAARLRARLSQVLSNQLPTDAKRRPEGRRFPLRWRGPESNWRHHDFQSCALPTELPRRSSPLIVASALLDRPHVAVGVLEEAEPRSGRALRAELLHLAYRHAAPGQSGPHGVDVLHDELHALHRARLPQWQPYADDHRARGAGRRHLDDPHAVAGLDVVVEVEAHFLGVERLRGVDVRNGHRNDFELEVHGRYARPSAAYSRRKPSNSRRWPSSSWRMSMTMSCVTRSLSSQNSTILL